MLTLTKEQAQQVLDALAPQLGPRISDEIRHFHKKRDAIAIMRQALSQPEAETMTPEQIQQWAREAHGPITAQWWDMDIAALQRFAALAHADLEAENAALTQEVANKADYAARMWRLNEELKAEVESLRAPVAKDKP